MIKLFLQCLQQNKIVLQRKTEDIYFFFSLVISENTVDFIRRTLSWDGWGEDSNQQCWKKGIDRSAEERSWGGTKEKDQKSQQSGDWGCIQHLHVGMEVPTEHLGGKIPQIMYGNMLKWQGALLRSGLLRWRRRGLWWQILWSAQGTAQVQRGWAALLEVDQDEQTLA